MELGALRNNNKAFKSRSSWCRLGTVYNKNTRAIINYRICHTDTTAKQVWKLKIKRNWSKNTTENGLQ